MTVGALAIVSCESSSPASAVDGPVMHWPDSAGSGDGMDAVVSGVLELEGECLYVARDELAERYPVLWPSGTRWDADAQAVVTASGEMLVAGDEVDCSGGCLYIGDIERLAGADAVELAQRCLDNTYGEIAVVKNSDSAIGRA